MKDTPEVRKALNMAHVRLVEKEAIDDIRRTVQEARTFIDSNSIPFPLVAGAKFIPASRRPDVEAKLTELKSVFKASVVLFIIDYEKHRAEMEPIIEKALKEAAKGEDYEKGLKRVLSLYPPQHAIRHKFHFDWVAMAVSAPLDGAVSDEVEKASGQVSDAVRSMVGSLRDRVTEKLGEIIDLIVRGGKFTAKTVNAAKRAIQNARRLNILNDSTLENALKQFEGVLVAYDGKSEDPSNFEAIRENLQKDYDKAVEEATERLMSLGERTVRV
jgi:hypothetical protein